MRTAMFFELETFVRDPAQGQCRGSFLTAEAAKVEADRLLAGYDEPRRSQLYRIVPFYPNSN